MFSIIELEEGKIGGARYASVGGQADLDTSIRCRNISQARFTPGVRARSNG